MFTEITLNNPNWSQQKNHGFLIDTRHVLDSFSFGSRSLLVSSSFVSRSSLVAYSLVYRRPNEDRTRNKQKTNERATRLGRESNEKLSKTRRQTIGLATRNPQTGLTQMAQQCTYCMLKSGVKFASEYLLHTISVLFT